MVMPPTSQVRSVTSSSGTSGIRALYGAARAAPYGGSLIAIQCADQQACADGEDRYAGCDFAGILFRVRRRLVGAALEEVARRVQVLLDIDVLHRGLQVVDHVVADAEFAEKLLQPAVCRRVAVLSAGRANAARRRCHRSCSAGRRRRRARVETARASES